MNFNEFYFADSTSTFNFCNRLAPQKSTTRTCGICVLFKVFEINFTSKPMNAKTHCFNTYFRMATNPKRIKRFFD